VTAEDVRAFATHSVAAAEAPRAPEERPAAVPAETVLATLPRAEPDMLPDFSRWGPIERLPLRSVRRATAVKMAQAWAHIPHVSHHDWADITALERCRQAWAHEIAEGKLTLLIFVMKAVVAALKQHPRFNASLDTQAPAIILKHYYHLGIAVDTERGLIVPVIRDVDRKSIVELAAELYAVVQQARHGETRLEDMQGGTFTITNIGRLGGRGFTPIINYPQVAILGMARANWQPVVQRPSGGEEMTVEPRLMLPLILAFDHRVVDGADAARFLQGVIDILEKPDTLVLRV
jgi:pyruvate dehydrogenase E2 component (dihydrolipoamide acetyltransferase)